MQDAGAGCLIEYSEGTSEPQCTADEWCSNGQDECQQSHASHDQQQTVAQRADFLTHLFELHFQPILKAVLLFGLPHTSGWIVVCDSSLWSLALKAIGASNRDDCSNEEPRQYQQADQQQLCQPVPPRLHQSCGMGLTASAGSASRASD